MRLPDLSQHLSNKNLSENPSVLDPSSFPECTKRKHEGRAGAEANVMEGGWEKKAGRTASQMKRWISQPRWSGYGCKNSLLEL